MTSGILYAPSKSRLFGLISLYQATFVLLLLTSHGFARWVPRRAIFKHGFGSVPRHRLARSALSSLVYREASLRCDLEMPFFIPGTAHYEVDFWYSPLRLRLTPYPTVRRRMKSLFPAPTVLEPSIRLSEAFPELRMTLMLISIAFTPALSARIYVWRLIPPYHPLNGTLLLSLCHPW